ncbi:anti-sigma factor [Methylobacterium sp. E-065]|uniref:anti-sigma factor family protein n=1 Tax=Methylobacterium sp. E-065 TaxID=2836583 RepID=UPI001FBB1523|nr:anti-sigma factor [Methylobacterium sp. E-065]MCJ2016557.1 anti-sigma factor [Methylobacterium sp. E-065]
MTGDDETLLLLSAYIDGELSPGEVLAMERRLAAEPELRATADRLRDLSASLRETLPGAPAPESLRGRVVQTIGFVDAAPDRNGSGSWRALAATLVFGIAVGAAIGGGAVYRDQQGAAPTTSEAVLASHLRGLAAPQPFDIASSDGHVVKPWFNGRTLLAPDAPDLADQGFPLIGGRIDIVAGKPVPTLVYRHDRHVISVTVVPATAGPPEGEERRDGSTILRWNAGDLTYWVVSDLNARALRSFIDLFQSRTTRQG